MCSIDCQHSKEIQKNINLSSDEVGFVNIIHRFGGHPISSLIISMHGAYSVMDFPIKLDTGIPLFFVVYTLVLCIM